MSNVSNFFQSTAPGKRSFKHSRIITVN